MKDHLEQSIKESLQGFEAPYNPAAWDAMRAQLDAKMPVNPFPKGGATKWYIAAAAIVGVGVGSYFLLNSNDESNTNGAPTEQASENEKISDAQNAVETSTDHLTATERTNSNPEIGNVNSPTGTASPQGGNASNPGSNPSNGNNTANSNGIGGVTNTGNPSATNNNSSQQGSNVTQNGGNEIQLPELKLPKLEDVCQNTVITITNNNNVPLILIGPGVYQMIPAKETSKIRMKKVGDYHVSEYKNEKGKHVEFEVKEAPAIDFVIDPMTKFEAGLPTTKLSANVPGTNYEWIINGERIYGAEADAHFYRQGTNDVTLVVTGSNGCESLLTKSVYVEDNYNLMAPTSFRPLSSDPAVNTFIPYALKERHTNFQMIIIDPTDGHVLFETKDAEMGWDGIDRKTGQLVAFDRVYVWKVTLDKAAKFEQRTDYSGQVIPVRAN